MSKMSLQCVLVVSSHGSAREQNPIPPLPQHRNNVRQVRRTATQSGEVSNHQDVTRLQIIQTFLPPRPGLRRPGGVFLKHADRTH
jgi:hypothetical protein